MPEVSAAAKDLRLPPYFDDNRKVRSGQHDCNLHFHETLYYLFQGKQHSFCEVK
jgi:hypothetical protein